MARWRVPPHRRSHRTCQPMDERLREAELMQGFYESRVGSLRGLPPRLEETMAKGQQKKSRENRKPKKEKVKTNASNPSVKPGSVKGLENMKNS